MAKASFNWIDPLLLDQQLTEEERMVRDSAQQFAADKLAPRVLEAFRHEQTDPKSSARWATPACSAPPSPPNTAAAA